MGIEALLNTQIIDTPTVGRAVMTASDAVQAAGANVSTALEILRQRLAILRECRMTNGATNYGFRANGSEASDPLECLAMAQQLIDVALEMAKS